MLEIDRDALLPAVARHTEAGLEEEAVEVDAVDRDDRRAEVGEQLRAERAGDREAEVEHDDAFERRADRSARVARRRPARRMHVAASARTSAVCSPGRAAPRIGGAATFSNPYAWPTMRTPSTSTTLPSRSNSGSRSASSGERTRWTGTPTSRRQTNPVVGRELRDRVAHRVVELVQNRHALRRRRHAAARRWRAQRGSGSSSSISRGVEDEARHRHPVVGPAAVGALEEPLRRARIEDPRVEPGAIGALDALPGADRRRERALQHRRVHVLAATGDLPCDERGVDRDGRVVERREADPRDAAEQRSGSRRADHAPVGRIAVRARSRRARADRSSCRRRLGSRTVGPCAPRRARRTRGDARASRSRRTR